MHIKRREFFARSAFFSAAAMAASPLTLRTIHAETASSQPVKRAPTDWFRDLKSGVFCHFLGAAGLSADDWNRRVDAFDTDRLVSRLAEAGAPYFFLTIGQNSGHFCSPNTTYDSIVGIKPSKCSRRDLIADLSASLSRRKIAFFVYLPSGAPAADPVAMERLKWEWGFEGKWPDAWMTTRTGKRLGEFQQMWESIVREWSLRWGKKVRGWWIDGCYFPDEMYRHPEAPNFQSFAAALKAGNPESLVAFNPGVTVPVISMTPFEDYTAGEISDAFPICPGRWVDGAQYHILSYLGESWCKGTPRFSDEFVIGYVKDVSAKGGVITWDVPIDETGTIPEAFLTQMKRLHGALRS